MKLITKLLLLVTLGAAPFLLKAQTVASTVNGINWSLVPTWPNVSLLNTFAYNSSGSLFSEGISTGLLKLEDNSIISNVQIDANSYGVIRLNKDLSSQWLTNFEGYPIAIGFFNGKILVISASEFSSFNGITNHYTGYMIDPKTGGIGSTKNIYNGSDQFYEQPVFLYAPDGSSFKIAIRTSNFTRGTHNPLLMFKMNKVADQYFTNNDFKLLEFDTNLEVKSTIKPVLEQGYFIGGTTNKNGDVFLMTDYSQGFIRIAKYENGKTTPAKVLNQAISMNDNIISNLHDTYLFTSKTDASVLFFAGTYVNGEGDRELVVSKFDFKNGNVKNNTQDMSKAYLKDLAKSYKPFSKKFDDVDLGSKNELKIRNLVENDGKLIVGLSSYTLYDNTMGGNHPSITAFDLLINIYDETLNLQYQQIIPRSYSSFSLPRLGIGMHCKNNVLYLIANNNKGIASYKALYSQVDLKNGAITTITGIEKNNIKRWYAIDPYASAWFDDQFLLSYMEEKGVFSFSSDAHLQLLNY